MFIGHRILKSARLFHLYLGVLSAPMLLFFAITGGLQTFSLHETTRGSSYTPPAWLASMAQLHKKQTMMMPVRRPRPSEPAVPPTGQDGVAATTSGQSAGTAGARPGRNLLPMKIFFALVSLSLLISTLTGLYMAWRHSRKPKLISVLLLAGIFAPVVLALL